MGAQDIKWSPLSAVLIDALFGKVLRDVIEALTADTAGLYQFGEAGGNNEFQNGVEEFSHRVPPWGDAPPQGDGAFRLSRISVPQHLAFSTVEIASDCLQAFDVRDSVKKLVDSTGHRVPPV
jgi:hypothetical protein